MPSVNDLYPDKYMKAHHLEEMDPEAEHYTFTIRGSGITTYTDGKKQISLVFNETNLELGLNKGNATMCEELFNSDDSDDWVGKKLVLHVEVVKNNFAPTGVGPAIRVSQKQTKLANKPKPAVITNPGALGKKQPLDHPHAKKATEPMTQAEVDEIDENEPSPF